MALEACDLDEVGRDLKYRSWNIGLKILFKLVYVLYVSISMGNKLLQILHKDYHLA